MAISNRACSIFVLLDTKLCQLIEIFTDYSFLDDAGVTMQMVMAGDNEMNLFFDWNKKSRNRNRKPPGFEWVGTVKILFIASRLPLAIP